MNKIRRSNTNYVISGLLGGIAEHFNWNVNLLRIIWLLLIFTPFSILIIYLILWMIISKE